MFWSYGSMCYLMCVVKNFSTYVVWRMLLLVSPHSKTLPGRRQLSAPWQQMSLTSLLAPPPPCLPGLTLTPPTPTGPSWPASSARGSSSQRKSSSNTSSSQTSTRYVSRVCVLYCCLTVHCIMCWVKSIVCHVAQLLNTSLPVKLPWYRVQSVAFVLCVVEPLH